MNYATLQKEITGWIGDGIISVSQGDKILARYNAEVPAYKKMGFWLQCLAATLVGLALFLVLSENWQRLPWFAQSAITAIPLIVAQWWAVRQENSGKPMAAEVGWFFASIALGANIMMQAQIFHISAYYPNGVLFWVIGILPVLWLRGSTVSYLLAAFLFFLYLTMQLDHKQFSFISLLPLAVFAAFTWSRQRAATILPLLAILYLFLLTVLAKWQVLSGGLILEYAYILFCAAILQRFTELKVHWLRRLVLALFVFATFSNILLTFKYFVSHEQLMKTPALALSIAALAIAALFASRNSLRERQITFIVVGNAALTIVCLYVARILGPSEDQTSLLFVRVAANLIYLASISSLLFHAIANRAKALFLGAVMGFLFWALVRYFDLFANYLITALIFVGSAFALVFMNRLWEKKYEK